MREGWTGGEVENRFGGENEERERLIRREKEWEEDRGTVMGGDREGGGEGGIRAGRYKRKKRQIVIVALGRERRTRVGGGGREG